MQVTLPPHAADVGRASYQRGWDGRTVCSTSGVQQTLIAPGYMLSDVGSTVPGAIVSPFVTHAATAPLATPHQMTQLQLTHAPPHLVITRDGVGPAAAPNPAPGAVSASCLAAQSAQQHDSILSLPRRISMPQQLAVKQEPEAYGASDWASADWMGDMMDSGSMESHFSAASMQLEHEFGYAGPPSNDGSWLAGKFMSGAGGISLDPPPANGRRDSAVLSMDGMFGDSFAVPDIRNGPAAGTPFGFLSDTAFPLGIAPEMYPAATGCGMALVPLHLSLTALRNNSSGDAHQVPTLVVNVPVKNETIDSGGGTAAGRAERRAARAARRAADPAGFASASGPSASDGSNGSDYTPDTDCGSAASDGTPSGALGQRFAPPPRANALALMPAIGSPQRMGRAGSRHPTDEELKEAIAALQNRATTLPLRSQSCATAARRECLLRYREKKLRRLDSNTIRYMKRKINADKRPRIKGRFVKAEELHLYRQGLLPGQNGVKPDLPPDSPEVVQEHETSDA